MEAKLGSIEMAYTKLRDKAQGLALDLSSWKKNAWGVLQPGGSLEAETSWS